jgi:glycosyltransferase involved in cell wall biosynthesis
MPTISLCMIVKNEAENLPRCLASVESLVDEMIVLDTGSTDGTVELARSLGAQVEHFAWCDDFSQARNVALEYVTGDWVLVLDADEVLRSESIAAIKRLIDRPEVLVINLIRQEIGAVQSPYSLVSRLFRRHKGVYFQRPYHAMIDDSVEALLKTEPSWQILQLDTCAIDHYGYTLEAIASQGKHAKARKMMEGFLAKHPDDAYVCSKLGALYIEMGEVDRGINLLNRGLQSKNIDPNTTYELHYHLAETYQKQQQLQRAFDCYQTAIAQPILPQLKLGALNNLATLLQDNDQLVEAEALYQEVLAIDPNLAIAHYNLGILYRLQNNFVSAIEHYEIAIGLTPENPNIHQNLGVVLMKVGQIPESLEAFGRAIVLHRGSEAGERLRQTLGEMGFAL